MKRILLIIACPLLLLVLVSAMLVRPSFLNSLADPPDENTYLASNVNGAASGSDDETAPVTGRIRKAVETVLAGLNINMEFAIYYAIWIVGAPTLVIVILIAMIFRPRQKKMKPVFSQHTITVPHKKEPEPPVKKEVPKVYKAPPAPAPEPEPEPEPEPATDKDRILKFFSILYRQQVNAAAEAYTDIVLVETRPICPNETYEIQITHGNESASRRMSIGLLGQGGGSRSKCFYIIYDSHMVLKIPSEAIQSFSDYQDRIKAEAAIVARLAPRECIVPRVAVILKAVHGIADSAALSEESLEAHYESVLELNPDLQEYLKIGPSFCFFMDLSRHFFLSSTLDEIHRGDKRIVHEAMKQHELLWDQHAFVCRYGEEAGSICHDLQDAYYRCEIRLRKVVEKARLMEEVSTFRLKQWFLTHLAGEKVHTTTEDLPESFIDEVNRLLAKVIQENHYQVEHYRQRVRRYIKEMRFSQHRIQLENLAANILDLLAWIGQKGVALRDLKPENLFVAGKPDQYPLFLNDAKKFSIGLIDVETAVVMDGAEPGMIPQPQLAGTPLYATPTHLITNAIICKVYSDLRKILHLQDWYATIAIIYKCICGKNLFSATARTFPEIIKRVKLIAPAGPDVDRDVAAISSLFWNSAQAEFEEALSNDDEILSRIEVTIPKAFGTDIIKALHRGSDRLSQRLNRLIAQQSVFIGRDKCQFLIDAPVAKIQKMQQKLVAEKPLNHERVIQRQEAMDVLRRIESLKTRLQRKLEAAAALKANVYSIAADQLLEAMFEKVFNGMHLSHWTLPEPAKWQGRAHLPVKDLATYQATM